MGYDPAFIPDAVIPLPTLSNRLRPTAFNNGEPVHYSRFSLTQSQARSLAIYTAHNIDGATLHPSGTIPRKDRFRFDSDLPRSIQCDDDRGYRNNPWDRGHLVRRQSMHWGDIEEAKVADQESYFWTNIAPQHHKLHDTAWGQIEDWMMHLADDNKQRVSVFTGPVFGEDDVAHVNREGEDPILIPAGFWKILVIPKDGSVRAAGFIVWQRDFEDDTPIIFDPQLEQVRLTTLEFITGLSFGDLRERDALRFAPKRSGLESMGAATPPKPSVSVQSHLDIVI